MLLMSSRLKGQDLIAKWFAVDSIPRFAIFA